MLEALNEGILSAIVFLLGGILAVLVGRWLRLPLLFTTFLYFWHSALGYFYSSYVLENGGDAFVYYQKARFEFVQADLGTDFVVWLTSFPTSLGFTYWPLAFLYNALGAAGLVFFYAALREVAGPSPTRLTRFLIPLCVLIPSLSFWTSGIGKDSIALLSVGLFLWSVMSLGRRQPGAVFGALIMFMVRPHIAILMVIAVAAGTLFVPRLERGVRLAMLALASAAAAFAVPLALLYAGTGRFASIGEYIGERQEQNLGGGSSIDITSMNPAFRLLSYLYRPLPTDASGVEQLAASLDNLFLIALTGVGLVAMSRAGFVRVIRAYGIPLLYGLACLLLLSQVTANLGLAMRQKWMLVPALMLVFVGAWTMLKEDAASADRKSQRWSGASGAMR
jgi:hypothetical protein